MVKIFKNIFRYFIHSLSVLGNHYSLISYVYLSCRFLNLSLYHFFTFSRWRFITPTWLEENRNIYRMREIWVVERESEARNTYIADQALWSNQFNHKSKCWIDEFLSFSPLRLFWESNFMITERYRKRFF